MDSPRPPVIRRPPEIGDHEAHNGSACRLHGFRLGNGKPSTDQTHQQPAPSNAHGHHRLEDGVGRRSPISQERRGRIELETGDRNRRPEHFVHQGAQDFRSGQKFDHTVFFGENVDIHHILPQDWCKKHGIKPKVYDSIINKTPLSYRTNRIIGGVAPSEYIVKLERGNDTTPPWEP
jgi:hypothetical protein